MPALVIAGFEELRHTVLIHWLPMSVGNWLTPVIDAAVIALVSRRWFQEAARTQLELHRERASRAILEERERLARVLHDQIAQTMFFAGVQLQSALKLTEQTGNRALHDKLADVLQSLREMDDNIRQAIFNLRAGETDGIHLEDRIRSYLRAHLPDGSLRWQVSFPPSPPAMTPAEQVQLFGIFQEAVTNVQKHAGAKHLWVSLQPAGRNGWEFTIEDDGAGIPETPVADRHYGLDIMHSRARDIGASVSVSSRPAGGTRIRVVLPAADRRQGVSPRPHSSPSES